MHFFSKQSPEMPILRAGKIVNVLNQDKVLNFYGGQKCISDLCLRIN